VLPALLGLECVVLKLEVALPIVVVDLMDPAEAGRLLLILAEVERPSKGPNPFPSTSVYRCLRS